MSAARDEMPVKMHLSINVTDLNRSIEFYQAFFGVPPHKVRPGYANFDLSAPPLKFALSEHPHPPEVGTRHRIGPLSHLSLQVPSAAHVNAAKERLRAAGLATFDETDTTCCYARQDKVWAHDPDGNAWEIYLLTDDRLDDHDHDHAGQPLPAEGVPSSTALSVPRFQPTESNRSAAPEDCCLDHPG
jgi:catechol 2,3-dioxygenase-like lactoylglutathione lyase family enzyme